jgi:large subunit ribosomal protein L23
VQKDQKEYQDAFNPESKKKPSNERLSIAEQAKALLRGEESWSSTHVSSQWEDDGEAQEVETDVTLPRI